MISTSRIATAHTAGQLSRVVKELKELGVETYGRDTREYHAFESLLNHDVQLAVEKQIRYLNEQLQRYQRECSEWLALMPGVPLGISNA